MTLDPDPTRHAVDLEQLFSGDRTWVKLCAELLERSIRDHQPVLDRADPTCSGCAHLRRAYEDLLAQSVALIERSARAESERTRLSGEFLRSVRHSHPERARQYETNPRVGRPLTSLSPELLADLVIAWSELTRAEASDTTAAKLAATKASANAVVDELADKLRALVAERDQLRELRASMGLDELGLPSMLVDQLAAGSITLHEFLRQAAGAGGSRAFSVGGKEIVVSLGAPADPSRRVLAAGATIEPAVPTTPDPAPRPMVPLPITAPALTTSPEPTRSTPSIEHAATTASAADERAPALAPAPTSAPAPAPAPAPAHSSEDHGGERPAPAKSSAEPSDVTSPRALRLEERQARSRPPVRTVTEDVLGDVLGDEAIRTIICTEAWSERRFVREMTAIRIDPTKALARLVSARLVRFVHAGSDGLLLPTASFLLASASLVASETASSSARAWSSVLESLSGEEQRRTFANVVAPFVSAGWNLVVVTKARDTSVLWLTLRRDDTGDTNDSSDSGAASTRYRSGILGVLLGPPPYQLAELHQLTAQQVNEHQVNEHQVIWLAGKPEDRADVRALPSDVDLWHADLTASADGDWVAIRSAPGHPLR